MSATLEKIARLRAMKGREPIPALTATDFPMAKLLDECGVPFLLVGDSLGMVTLGYPNTTHVTMADMQHHLRAVAAGIGFVEVVDNALGFLLRDVTSIAAAIARGQSEHSRHHPPSTHTHSSCRR